MTDAGDVDLDDPGTLLRPDVLDDPRAFHDALRARAPVWKIPGQDTFVVSDPALVREAVGRPDEWPLGRARAGRPLQAPCAMR